MPLSRLERGFTLVELLVAFGIFLLLAGLAAMAWRQFAPRQSRLSRVGAFQLAAGGVFEQLKQDVRSARKVAVLPDRLDLIRTVEGATGGSFREESVAYFAEGTDVCERRDEVVKRHRLAGQDDREGMVRLACGLSGRSEELGGQRGMLSLKIEACDRRSQPRPGLVASLSLQIQALEMTP